VVEWWITMDPVKTAKVKLVVVIAPFELAEHLTRDFRALGVVGSTTSRVNGHGVHGTREYGALDGANTRFEIVCTAALATRILGHVVTEFEGRAVTAFSLDVEAVPADHFS
jgi:hypothetical protein